MYLDILDLVRPRHQSLGKREPEGVISQVRRSRHHHGVADSADLDCNGGLDRNAARKFEVICLVERELADGKVAGLQPLRLHLRWVLVTIRL